MLPIFQSQSREMSQMQTEWASQLNPLLDMPFSSGLLLTGVHLINGVTTINHKLARKLQGYIITDIDSAATIFRSQPKNALTLTLTSNAATNVSLFVF